MADLVKPRVAPCDLLHDHEAEPEDCCPTPVWQTCRYYQTADRADVATEPCSFGCWEEPNCVTGQPSEGWPTEEDTHDG